MIQVKSTKIIENEATRARPSKSVYNQVREKTRLDWINQKRWGKWVNNGAIHSFQWSGESSQWASVSGLFSFLQGLWAVDWCHRLCRETTGPTLPRCHSLVYFWVNVQDPDNLKPGALICFLSLLFQCINVPMHWKIWKSSPKLKKIR